MAVVNLLGDSIIDNKIYVGQHELSVSEHLHNLTDDIINILAVDGHTTKDVLNLRPLLTNCHNKTLVFCCVRSMKEIY